jgi:hypothetical protein
MGNGAELEEPPITRYTESHLIKPKLVEKFKNNKDYHRTQTTEIHQGNAVSRQAMGPTRDAPHKMSDEQKQRILRAKRQLEDAVVHSKPIVEENTGIALGQNVIEVEDKASQKDTVLTNEYVQEPKAPKLSVPGDNIPTGQQYKPSKPSHVSTGATNLFPIFDYAIFEHKAEEMVADIEHSTAISTGSSFKPMRTPFDQHTSTRYADLVERSTLKKRIFHNHKNIAEELGKYEAMITDQDRFAYIAQDKRAPATAPQLGQEMLIQTPQRDGPPAFIRSTIGGQWRYSQGPADVEA